MNKTMSVYDTAAPKTRRRKTVSLDKKKARAGWLFVLPFVIGFVLVYLPMIIESISYTFIKVVYTPNGDLLYKITPVGLSNYQTVLFENTDFVETLVTGTVQLIIDIPAIIIFSLFMAVILNQKMFGRAVFRAIFFIPVIVSTGIIAQHDLANAELQQQMSGGVTTGDQSTGANGASSFISATDITALFSNMMVGSTLVNYVVQIINNIYNIVNRSGVQLLIFLAGLQSISPAIYESCSIDGATSWETFWKITFPMISPMILVNAVYTIIDSFTAPSNSVMSFITNHFVKSNEEATTMAWIYFLIVIVIVAVIAGIMSAYIFYQRKDG